MEATTKIYQLLWLEWLATLLALSGAALLAAKVEASGWGWVLFLFSNCCWVVWGVIEKRWSIVVMQIGFTPTSVLGIARWLF